MFSWTFNIANPNFIKAIPLRRVQRKKLNNQINSTKNANGWLNIAFHNSNHEATTFIQRRWRNSSTHTHHSVQKLCQTCVQNHETRTRLRFWSLIQHWNILSMTCVLLNKFNFEILLNLGFFLSFRVNFESFFVSKTHWFNSADDVSFFQMVPLLHPPYNTHGGLKILELFKSLLRICTYKVEMTLRYVDFWIFVKIWPGSR